MFSFQRTTETLPLSSAERYPFSVRNRLQIAASRLAQAGSLLPGGSTGGTLGDDAHAPALASPPVIGAASVLNGATAAPFLAPNSMGFIYADQTGQTPLAMQQAATAQLTADALPFELASASVTIAGRAAQVFDVSPTRISFCVPAGLPAGDAEVIVTSQEGYVSRGTVTIGAIAPGLFSAHGAGQVRHLVAAAEVVALAVLAVRHRFPQPRAMIVDVQPLADLLALAVHGQPLAGRRVRDHQRDELLGQLIRSVVVAAIRDHHRHAVRLEVGPR